MMVLIPLFLILLLFLGYKEYKSHQKNVDSIPIRININGIRGKSTVTRLTTGILTEAGYDTVGKTTGTSARIIYWDEKEETPIIRRAEGANINEQVKVIKLAAEKEAEALVSECMAVNPDYQVVFQDKMLQANIGVIVNVLEDHLDVMGPTLDQIAEAFVATIPYNGKLIVSEGPYVDFYRKKAKERNTDIIVADNDEITDEFLSEFNYMVFPENASLALAIARALEIDDETARRGMLNARPDPGAMQIHQLSYLYKKGYFINAFAANDPTSTINIWRRIGQLGYSYDDSIVIMNCRSDRVDRTIQFAEDVLPHLEIGTLILIGETIEPVVEAFNSGKIQAEKLEDYTAYSASEINLKIMQNLQNNLIFGLGNIHGAAEALIELLVDEKENN